MKFGGEREDSNLETLLTLTHFPGVLNHSTPHHAAYLHFCSGRELYTNKELKTILQDSILKYSNWYLLSDLSHFS